MLFPDMDQNNPLLTDANVDQVGIVVHDLHETAENLYRILGIGPFRIMEWPIDGIDPESTYHGEPEKYRLLLGFARQGATQIELIEPLEGRNIWSDFLEDHGPGLHHFRLVVTDFDEKINALEKAGIKNIASGTGAHVGSKWAYFDTTEILNGVFIELRTHLAGADGEGQWAIAGDESGT